MGQHKVKGKDSLECLCYGPQIVRKDIERAANGYAGSNCAVSWLSL